MESGGTGGQFSRRGALISGYLRATITDDQRQEFGALVEDTLRRIESGLFLPQAAFVFRRIHVQAVPSLACASTNLTWSSVHSCAKRESILVCLTNLFTRYPPMPPKLNSKRALFVLTKIDEILAWEKQKEAERDTRFVDLGR
jgi:hypothetical protein